MSQPRHCSCGRQLRPTFRHCPGCGSWCGPARAEAGSSALVLRLGPFGSLRRPRRAPRPNG